MTQPCGIYVKVSRISVQVLPPALCKAQNSYSTSHDPHIERMEKALNVWIDNHQDRGHFKVAKDCLALLLCGNAAGDFNVKPMLFFRSLNPSITPTQQHQHHHPRLSLVFTAEYSV